MVSMVPMVETDELSTNEKYYLMINSRVNLLQTGYIKCIMISKE